MGTEGNAQGDIIQESQKPTSAPTSIIFRMTERDMDKAARFGVPSYVWRAGQQRRLDMIVKAAGERHAGQVLENGCGVGAYIEHLQPYGGRVVGLEYDRGKWQIAYRYENVGDDIQSLVIDRFGPPPFVRLVTCNPSGTARRNFEPGAKWSCLSTTTSSRCTAPSQSTRNFTKRHPTQRPFALAVLGGQTIRLPRYLCAIFPNRHTGPLIQVVRPR